MYLVCGLKKYEIVLHLGMSKRWLNQMYIEKKFVTHFDIFLI